DLTQPQVFPQFAFCRRLVATQFARASFHDCVIRHGLILVRALQINRTTSPQSPFTSEGEARHHSSGTPTKAIPLSPPSFRRGKMSSSLFLREWKTGSSPFYGSERRAVHPLPKEGG